MFYHIPRAKTATTIRREQAAIYDELTIEDRVTSINTCDHTQNEMLHGTQAELEQDGWYSNIDLCFADEGNSFTGKYSFLHPCSFCCIEYAGKWYFSVMHLYLALRCKYQEDADRFEANGEFGKESGYKVASFAREFYIRDNWSEELSLKAMKYAFRTKFDQEVPAEPNSSYWMKLRRTRGIDLCYKNTFNDTHWGVVDGKGGRNLLGKLLTELRDEEEYADDYICGKPLEWENFVGRKFNDYSDPSATEDDGNGSSASHYYSRDTEDAVLG